MCRNDAFVLKEVGESCASDNECQLGWCDDGTCGVPILECPTDTDDICSGHGSCEYTDRNGRPSGRICTILDLDCQAICLCEGYGGASCSLSVEELLDRSATRTSLCAAVVEVSQGDDVTFTFVDSLIKALYSAYDPNEVTSAEGRAVCYEALAILSQYSADGFLSDESAALIMDVTGKFVIDAASSGNTDTSRRLADGSAAVNSSEALNVAVSKIISGVLQTMAEGEEPIVFANSQLEVSIYKTLPTNLTELATPQTSAVNSYLELAGNTTAESLSSASGYVEAS
eukprot:gene34172-38623_t